MWRDSGGVKMIPFLMARNFQDGRVDLSGACKIPKLLGDSLRIGFARTGDVLLTHKGSIGLVAIVPDVPDYVMLTPQVTYYRTNPNKLVNSYLKYAFQAPFFHDQLNSFSAQSTRPYIGITAQRELLLDVPPVPMQRQIAGILSTYDDLIENSQRRIKILEAMARAIYREWFVSEKLPRSLSALVPRKSRLGELCDLVRKPYSDGLHSDRPLLDLSRMPQHSLAPGDTGAASELTTSRILFEPGDTLFGAIRCYLHKVNAAHFSGVTNTSVLVLRPKIATFRSLVAIVASDTETIRWADTHSTGTKMPVINWGVLQTMPAPLPSEDLAKAFEDVAGPMLDQIGLLATQIQNLRRTRDLLLPRLLSGQIEVEAA
jgi:type I restriction enzyme S subunit